MRLADTLPRSFVVVIEEDDVTVWQLIRITLTPFARSHWIAGREIAERAKPIDILFAFTDAHSFIASGGEFVEMIKNNSRTATRNPGTRVEMLLPESLIGSTNRAM